MARNLNLLIVFSTYLLIFSGATKDNNQITSLNKFIKSRRCEHEEAAWTEEDIFNLSPHHILPQEGSMDSDRIDRLPGQPEVDFDHYAGYVTVGAEAERALFYYFAESPHDSSTKPLVMWLNGGPGCSSLGYGAMEELGPFRVKSDRETLYRNEYAWNNVANVLFLESPVGVGFSYSNKSSDYRTSDKSTAKDSYTFLLNWLERFPRYKTRGFYITGESYAGHFVPQLASLILCENKKTNKTLINLRGIAIGNAVIDDTTTDQGMYDYYWSHALISDKTPAAINKYCDFVSENLSDKCKEYIRQEETEYGDNRIDIYNIYAPVCNDNKQKPGSSGSVKNFDPCSDNYVAFYLHQTQVKEALHARNTSWQHCRDLHYKYSPGPTTILPTINLLMKNNISVWTYSGDVDGRVPVTSTRYSINKLKLPIESPWRPWKCNKEVGGYVVAYKGGLVLITIKDAGHTVPSSQPERALVMISSFLEGKLLGFMW